MTRILLEVLIEKGGLSQHLVNVGVSSPHDHFVVEIQHSSFDG